MDPHIADGHRKVMAERETPYWETPGVVLYGYNLDRFGRALMAMDRPHDSVGRHRLRCLDLDLGEEVLLLTSTAIHCALASGMPVTPPVAEQALTFAIHLLTGSERCDTPDATVALEWALLQERGITPTEVGTLLLSNSLSRYRALGQQVLGRPGLVRSLGWAA